jgi:hypothetical protein
VQGVVGIEDTISTDTIAPEVYEHIVDRCASIFGTGVELGIALAIMQAPLADPRSRCSPILEHAREEIADTIAAAKDDAAHGGE